MGLATLRFVGEANLTDAVGVGPILGPVNPGESVTKRLRPADGPPRKFSLLHYIGYYPPPGLTQPLPVFVNSSKSESGAASVVSSCQSRLRAGSLNRLQVRAAW